MKYVQCLVGNGKGRQTMNARDKLIEMVEESILDPMMAVKMCAQWMEIDEVAEMLDANELSERFTEDENN